MKAMSAEDAYAVLTAGVGDESTAEQRAIFHLAAKLDDIVDGRVNGRLARISACGALVLAARTLSGEFD